MSKKKAKKVEHKMVKTSMGAKCSCGEWIIFGNASSADDLYKLHLEYTKEGE